MLLTGTGITPAISETGIILDLRKIGIGILEFLPDAFDESADICAIPDFARTRGESFAVHHVVKLAVGHIAASFAHQAIDHLEFRHREENEILFPECALAFAIKADIPEFHYRFLRGGSIRSFVAAEDQFEAPQKNGESPRFLDEVDSALDQPRLFIKLIAE